MARVSLPGRAHRDVDIWPRTRYWQTLIVVPESNYFEEENDMTLEEPAQHCFDQMVNISSVWMGWHFCLSCVFCVAASLSMRKYRPIWGWGVPHWMKGPSRDITVSKRMRGYYRSIDNNTDMTLGWNVGPEGEKCGCCHNWGRACLWAGLVLQ